MATWQHAVVGEVDFLPPLCRPKKVWKHLFDPAEHWERICAQDLGAARREAEAVLGYSRKEKSELPYVDGGQWQRARQLLAQHHDAIYGPAYQAEMNSPETRWGPMNAHQRVAGLTPRSVWLVVELGSPSCVITAFRPHPPTQGVDWDEADFRRHALSRFNMLQYTDMDAENLVRATVENLRRAVTIAPRSVRELWWLASATGYGRMLSKHAAVFAVLPAAEANLRGADLRLVAELRAVLDWDACSRELASGLKEESSEAAEQALATAEELLAVATTIGAEVQADLFCADAEALIAWAPAAWTHLANYAAGRCRAFGDADNIALRLWNALDTAVLGAALRQEEPVVRPTAQLVDAILPQVAPWYWWTQQVAALASNMGTALGEWVHKCCEALTVRRPAPALGGTRAALWEIHGQPATNAPAHYRVFVVDADHPEGHEVTNTFTNSDGHLWDLEKAADRAVVLVIAARHPLTVTGLEALLNDATQRDDVVVQAREIHPTQATKDSR